MGAAGDAEIQTEFLVDTGFTGFAAVPDWIAQGLGMPFWSFQSTRLADDSTRTGVDCVGRIKIDGEIKELFVSVMPDSQSAAVGMSFLRLFDLDMFMFEGKFFDLISPKEQEEQRKEQEEKAAKKAKEKAAPIKEKIKGETTVVDKSS